MTAALLLLAWAAALGQGTAAKPGSTHVTAKEQIARAAQQMKTLQCDFVQTKQLRLLNDKMVAEGRMYYSQADRLRWEYVKPYEYVFILNGDRVLLKNSQRSDVVDVAQNKLFREIARLMLSSVVGTCLDDDRSFKVTLAEEKGEWVATLVPQRKDMKQLFCHIVLHFDQRQATVSRVEMVEKNGDVTIIELKNIRKNETIAPRLFAVD